MAEGDDAAQLMLSDDGRLGALNTFASDGGADAAGSLVAGQWHTISLGASPEASITRPQPSRVLARILRRRARSNRATAAVDAASGVLRTFVDGHEGVTIRHSRICRDGQFALTGRLALFFGCVCSASSP